MGDGYLDWVEHARGGKRSVLEERIAYWKRTYAFELNRKHGEQYPSVVEEGTFFYDVVTNTYKIYKNGGWKYFPVEKAEKLSRRFI